MDKRFLGNKYTTWYFAIITKARSLARASSGIYLEKHHVIPKSFNGSDHDSNLVLLTAREHFVCHWLLTKMVSKSREKFAMLKAFTGMLGWKSRRKLTSRQFDIIREAAMRLSPSAESNARRSKSMKGKVSSRKGLSLSKFYGNEGRAKEIRQRQSTSLKGKKKSKYHRVGSANSMRCTDGNTEFSSVKALAHELQLSVYLTNKLLKDPLSPCSFKPQQAQEDSAEAAPHESGQLSGHKGVSCP